MPDYQIYKVREFASRNSTLYSVTVFSMTHISNMHNIKNNSQPDWEILEWGMVYRNKCISHFQDVLPQISLPL